MTLPAAVSTSRNEVRTVALELRALANGVTKEEIGELITHQAFYAGGPGAMPAAKVVKQVYEEKKA